MGMVLIDSIVRTLAYKSGSYSIHLFMLNLMIKIPAKYNIFRKANVRKTLLMSKIIQTIINTFSERGNNKYGAEEVTQLQHALQSALLAEEEQASAELISAALLHDIGHIIESSVLPNHNNQNLDDLHEERAYQWLVEHFGKDVADPVRLHVVAKRYLCTKDETYEKSLSPTSYKSYLDQGGKMNMDEISKFENEPRYQESLRLRRWDDLAKIKSKETPDIEHFIPYLEKCLQIK